jgi:hypothetical protein
VDSSAFRQRAPRVQLSEDPDTATQQTVQEMCRQIAAASRDPPVRRIAFDAVRRIRGGPLWLHSGILPFKSARVMAESCWWWCKHAMKFRHHGDMFEVWSRDLGDPRTKLQLLISPDVLVRMARLEGDCAIYTMMLAAMLESLGLHWEICTAAVDRRQPTIFSHVWPRVILEDGGREPLDASHGKYPGWQVPAYDIHRLKVWDEAGREVSNQARQFDGLHAYRGSSRRRRGFGSLVCLDPNDTSSCYEDNSSTTDTVWTNPYPPGSPVVQGPVAALPPSAQITVPAQNTAAYAALAAQLVKGGFTLAELNAMQPGTVINPSGQIVRQAPGYAVTSGGAVLGSPLNIGAGGSSSLLMIAGLIVGGVVLMSMFKGGR